MPEMVPPWFVQVLSVTRALYVNRNKSGAIVNSLRVLGFYQ